MEWIYPVLGKQKSLPFYLSGVGIADPEYHVVRESGLISHQLLYTCSGTGSLVVDGVQYPQKPGSLFYLAPKIPHEYFPIVEEEWSTCWVVFRGEYSTELLRGMGFERFAYQEGLVNEEIEKIFRQMLSAAKDPIMGDERCSLLVYEYLLAVRRAFMEREKYGNRTEENILEKTLLYMNDHYASDITLEELAKISGVSRQHFCRVFRAKMKMRPMEYLARKRISVARGLLVSTKLSVAEIGEAVGYHSLTYFGMVFKKYEGISPTDCRKRHGTEQMW